MVNLVRTSSFANISGIFRHMWTLLKQKKEGKIILLTPHFMD